MLSFRLIKLNFKEWIMELKDIGILKKILMNHLEELLVHVGDTVSGMAPSRENFPDPADRSTPETDRNFVLRIRGRERQLAGEIRNSLLRIENDTIGTFEKCEEEISF